MNKIIGCLLVSFFCFAETGSCQMNSLKSPDGRIEIKFQTANNLNEPITYQLFWTNKPIINSGKIRLDIEDQKLVVKKVEQSKKRGHWKTVYGERKFIPENFNQLKLSFQPVEATGLRLTILLRVYNEGFAYQYMLHGVREIVLKNEASQFGLPENATAWVSSTAQGILKEKKLSEIGDVVERPLTIQLNESLYLALGEAGLVDFARMKFTFKKGSGMITKFDGETKGSKELKSPWRYVLLANSPADLLQKDYILLNLNAPNQIKNTKWIKPGKVLREVTLNTSGAFRTIDFAAQHHIGYILFDAGWYGREDHDSSDARRVSLDPLRAKGTLDLKEVVRYGNTKNVGVILYVNRRALERQLDSLLPLYKSWGVKGLKFGFVQVGSQKWTSWLHEAIQKCARYQMVVDVHDEYRPTGFSRTYPNLLTQEGIRGDEESPTTEHS
ncbi:MAG: alpha-glucosidase, partial [Flavobacterium sp.]